MTLSVGKEITVILPSQLSVTGVVRDSSRFGVLIAYTDGGGVGREQWFSPRDAMRHHDPVSRFIDRFGAAIVGS